MHALTPDVVFSDISSRLCFWLAWHISDITNICMLFITLNLAYLLLSEMGTLPSLSQPWLEHELSRRLSTLKGPLGHRVRMHVYIVFSTVLGAYAISGLSILDAQ